MAPRLLFSALLYEGMYVRTRLRDSISMHARTECGLLGLLEWDPVLAQQRRQHIHQPALHCIVRADMCEW